MTFARLLRSLQRMNVGFSRGLYVATLLAPRVSILALPLLVLSCIAQEPTKSADAPVNSVNTPLPVNGSMVHTYRKIRPSSRLPATSASSSIFGRPIQLPESM